MARRSSKRPWSHKHRDLNINRLSGVPKTEIGPDGRPFQVQRIQGNEKHYTCPGCLHMVNPWTPHVVAWPEDAPFGMPQGVEGRRHWHNECWRRGLHPA